MRLSVMRAAEIGDLKMSEGKELPRRPDVPCGVVLGHGDHCAEGCLCTSCRYILALEGRLGIVHVPVDLSPTKEMEGLWDAWPEPSEAKHEG